jgi:hypothetical protein
VRSSKFPAVLLLFSLHCACVEISPKTKRMSTDRATRQRTSFTDIERQGLRAHHQKYPATSRPALASWFELQFGRKISVSSVHDILSDKYAYLDNGEATAATRKQRGPQWRDLEDTLFRWWHNEQPRRVTGKELKDKANELWRLIPACQGKNIPSFSDGWLTNWRTRHGLAQPRGPEKFTSITPSGDSMQVQMAPKVIRFDLPQFMMPTMADPLMDRYRTKRQCTKRLEMQPTKLNVNSVIDRPTSELMFLHTVVVTPQTLHKTSSSFNSILWHNVWELFLNSSTQAAHDTIMPAERILNVFNPILRAAELDLKAKNSALIFNSHRYMWQDTMQQRKEALVLELGKAINFLNTAGLFKLPRSAPERHGTIYDEWFLDFMRPEVLRSTSPEIPEDESGNFSTHVRQSTETLSLLKRRKSQHHTAITLSVGNGGRIDVWTRTCNGNFGSDEDDLVEQVYVNITITPPRGTYSVPQTAFRLSRETSQYKSTLLTPIISFRRTRPDSDDIFKIARYGTSEALQRALSSGKASLTDCDTKGRSLVNVCINIPFTLCAELRNP